MSSKSSVFGVALDWSPVSFHSRGKFVIDRADHCSQYHNTGWDPMLLQGGAVDWLQQHVSPTSMSGVHGKLVPTQRLPAFAKVLVGDLNAACMMHPLLV